MFQVAPLVPIPLPPFYPAPYLAERNPLPGWAGGFTAAGFYAAGAGPRTGPGFRSYAQVANWQVAGTAAVSIANVSWLAGDDIYVIGGTANGATFTGVPTATGLTFTLLASITPGAGACAAYVWRARAISAGGPVTVSSSTVSASQSHGISVLVASGSDGPGTPVTGQTGTARSLSLTRVADDSGALFANFDWTAQNPAPTAWIPSTPGLTQRTATADGINYGVEIATWGDQDAAATDSYGQSGTATANSWSKIAVEIKGQAQAGQTATVAMAGGSSMSVTGQKTVTPAVAMAGGSLMSVTGSQTISSTVAMVGSSAMTVVGDLGTQILMAGSSSMTISGLQTIAAIIAMVGSSGMTVTPLVTHPATILMAGTGAMAVTPQLTVLATIAMAGANALSITGQQTIPATILMAGTSSMAVTAALTRLATILMASSSTMAVSGLQTIPSTIAMAGSNVMVISVTGQQTATIAMVGSSSMSVTAQLTKLATILMASSSAMTITPAVSHPYPIAMAGANVMTINGRQTVPATVAMLGANAMTVIGEALVPVVGVFKARFGRERLAGAFGASRFKGGFG